MNRQNRADERNNTNLTYEISGMTAAMVTVKGKNSGKIMWQHFFQV